ncbi:MAG: UDP-N-acetylmuramate:L-alanyl-gamma-D-glutamyl-meso-diaminopimelate ligase, partial [Gammaproteobacteria bacterium RIFCSPHIGHO2_12_FULL_42_10]
IYPPMSTQLLERGIQVFQGYNPKHLASDIDLVIVGNVISRGNPAIEYVLDNHLPYTSGPAWLAENILSHRTVLAVAGTHGKTTTTSLLTWLLQCAGLAPGFLIGGVPENFGVSARLGELPYFVIEADEYDSAFFDKRSKFVHYHPDIAILNNLEFDHADIFSNLEAIKQQFHFLIRTVPRNGLLITHAEDENLQSVLQKGCWTKTQTFSQQAGNWRAALIVKDGSHFRVMHEGQAVGEAHSPLLGEHNVENTLAALAAATHVGVPIQTSLQALATFKNVKRRLEIKSTLHEIIIYDDFAHHPTAILKTLAGLRAKIGEARLIAVLEFGSYTMRSGVHQADLECALAPADLIFCKSPALDWGLQELLHRFKQKTFVYDNVETLILNLAPQLRAKDHVVIMSNTHFEGIHQRLIDCIA